MDVSISIVSYNTRELLVRCIKSIYKNTKGIRFEVIVVDNGSTDKSAEVVQKLFPKVSIIANKKNLFFTKANNQALKIAKGRYFLILNSDTYFVDNCVRTMIAYMDRNPKVGACEGLELYENGKILATGSRLSTPLIDFYELSLIGKKFGNRRLLSWYRMGKKDRSKTFSIDVGCDAFLMVRKDVMDTIGGYDEKLLLYYTENDLCLRIKKHGVGVVHLGNAKVMHTVSASVEKLGWRRFDIYYKDLLYYYKKHGYAVSGMILFALLKCEEVFLKLIKR